MYKFKDYFSRKELFYLGIDSEVQIDSLSQEYSGEKKYDKIESEMKKIYSFIKASHDNVVLNEKAKKTSDEIFNDKVQRRIVAAFYDVGILYENDLKIFPLDYRLDDITKTKISVIGAIDEESVCFEKVQPASSSKERKL